MQKFFVPQYNWYVDTDLELTMPDDWDVEHYLLPGDSWPVLTGAQIEDGLNSPIGTPRLVDIAKGKQRAIIVVDDISRPTPAHEIVPYLIRQLHEGGMQDDQIEFLIALGAHGAHTYHEMAKKLGADIVRRYPVYNHNCYDNCVNVGALKNGAQVMINAEYVKCDLKIGIGAVLPHVFNGLSGTGKIIVPGIAHIDTIMGTHVAAAKVAFEMGLNAMRGLGNWEESQMRKDVEEVALLAGPDFLVETMVGTHRQLIGLTAGHPVSSYRAMIGKSLLAYGIDCARDMDIVFANAGVKGCEAGIAKSFGATSLKEGGDLVLICHCPIGQITHYLFSKFGRDTYGRIPTVQGKPLSPDIGRLIVYTPYPSYTDAEWFGRVDQIIWATTWEEVMSLLSKHGPGTRAAIYQDGTLMYFKN